MFLGKDPSAVPQCAHIGGGPFDHLKEEYKINYNYFRTISKSSGLVKIPSLPEHGLERPLQVVLHRADELVLIQRYNGGHAQE